MHNALKKTINAEEQLIKHNGENIMKNSKEQLMKNNREQVMENKPLLFARTKNAGAALLFAVLALCRPENTAGAVEGVFTYELIESGAAAQITGYSGSDVDLVIPDTLEGKPVTVIGSGVFYQKTTLQSVSFPNSLVTIRDSAFQDCTGLKQVTLPAFLTEVQIGAFWGCIGLTNFSISASVTRIDGFPRFLGCDGLTQFNVHSNNLHFSSQDGVLFNKQKTELMQYPTSKSDSSYTVPGSVQIIGGHSFDRCSELTEITIPASVNSPLSGPFFNCLRLQTVRFEGDSPGGAITVFRDTGSEFTVQFYEGARGFTAPVWTPNPGQRSYSSEALPIIFPIWRSRFGLAADDVTAENGEPLLIAYALDLDPKDSAAFLPLPFVESGAIRLDFPAHRSGVSLMVERTSDPVAGVWQPAAVTTNSGTGSFSLLLSGSPEKLYLRFTAEQTE